MPTENETPLQRLNLSEPPEPRPPLPVTPQEGLRRLDEDLLAIKSPVPNRPSGITAQKVVQTSGIPEQLPNIQIPDGFGLVVKAKKANTGTVYIGFNRGQANKNGADFFSLAANEQVSYEIQNASAIWIDVSVSGEGVELTVEQ